MSGNLHVLAGQIDQDEAAFILIHPLVSNQIPMDHNWPEIAINENLVLFPKLQQGFIEIQHRSRVSGLRSDVDRLVIGIDRKPSLLTSGETSRDSIIPLHRAPGVVPVDPVGQFITGLLGKGQLLQYPVDQPAADVLALLGVLQREIGHPDLLALVDERGTPEGEIQNREGFPGGFGEPHRIAIMVDRTRLVVILEVIGHPGHPSLPFIDLVPKITGLELPLEHRDEEVVAVGGVELEEHVELVVIEVAFPVLDVDGIGLADDGAVVMGEDIVIESA